MDTEFIQFRKVTKRFGKNTVLDTIDLTIPEGKITGIIGASGEGKSTILKLMIGFYKPTKGDIYYLRRNIFKEMKDIEKNFGFATEDGSFYSKLTVKENVYHFGRLYGLKKSVIKERLDYLIKLVNLEKGLNTLAENLSIGMKKRLDILCALIHKPSVLIMDEPTADLDPLLREEMLELIKSINKQGTTVILTTQLLGEMDKICDKIAILFNEKIIEEGDPRKIKSKYNKKDLEEVFNKIFSRKARKTYSESTKEKTVVEPLKPVKIEKFTPKDPNQNKEKKVELSDKTLEKVLFQGFRRKEGK